MFYIHLSTARSLHSTTTAYSCENRANGGFVDVFAVQRGTTMIQWLWPLGSERYVGGWLNHVACGRQTPSDQSIAKDNVYPQKDFVPAASPF